MNYMATLATGLAAGDIKKIRKDDCPFEVLPILREIIKKADDNDKISASSLSSLLNKQN